jgi:hypothetical protein
MSCFIFNWLIYRSSIITSQGLYISCYATPILTACQFFNFYLFLMCNTIFVCTWVRWQAHNFTKYFCDIHYEYITPCVVMTCATSDAIWVMPPLRTLCSWVMVWSDRVDNMMDNSGGNQLTFYHILPIIHAYNAGISRLRSEDVTPIICPTPVERSDSGHMPDSDRKMWLRSYAQLWSEDITPVVYPDSGCTSWLRSMSRL